MTEAQSVRAPLSFTKVILILFALAVFSVVASFYSLASGSVEISILQVAQSLSGQAQGLESQIILDIRLPRVISGFLVGGMLALAGALMQVLLRNPLAEPYVLGISGGAAVFALLAMVVGLAGLWVNLGAVLGALLSMLMVFVLSHTGGQWNPLRVLLTGVVVAAGWAAVISFLLAVSSASQVHGMLFWLMGDLGYASYSHWSVLVLVLALLLSLIFAPALNLLSRGELQAAALGVSVLNLRYLIYFLSSLLTAVAVMQAGSIGFVGLIIPHIVRLVFGSDHRLLLPASILLGGSLLVVADGLARTIIAPQQLPVGILTAMLGVPLFLVLLQKTHIQQRP